MKIIGSAGVAPDHALPTARRRPSGGRLWRMLIVAAVSVMAVAAGLVGAGPATAGPVGKRVDSDYTLLRSASGSWVIGTAYRDWSVRDEGGSGGYSWARVGGDLNRCLWISHGATTTNHGRVFGKPCGAPRASTGAEFKKLFTNGWIGSNKAGNDGKPVLLRPTGDCVVRDGKIDGWGNVKPWRAKTDPTHRLTGALTVGSDGASTSRGYLVKARYITRDGRFVMVHATRYGRADGRFDPGSHGLGQDWFFVQRSCLRI
jgi:hypothetical protein